MHNPYIFVSAMCNFKVKLHFLFITKLSLSICWNVVLLSLPSALSGDFSGNSHVLQNNCSILFSVQMPFFCLCCWWPLWDVHSAGHNCLPSVSASEVSNLPSDSEKWGIFAFPSSLMQVPWTSWHRYLFSIPCSRGGHSMWSYGWQKGTVCPCSESRGGNLKYCYQENYSDIY